MMTSVKSPIMPAADLALLAARAKSIRPVLPPAAEVGKRIQELHDNILEAAERMITGEAQERQPRRLISISV
jgi:hypothetical protein